MNDFFPDFYYGRPRLQWVSKSCSIASEISWLAINVQDSIQTVITNFYPLFCAPKIWGYLQDTCRTLVSHSVFHCRKLLYTCQKPWVETCPNLDQCQTWFNICHKFLDGKRIAMLLANNKVVTKRPVMRNYISPFDTAKKGMMISMKTEGSFLWMSFRNKQCNILLQRQSWQVLSLSLNPNQISRTLQ